MFREKIRICTIFVNVQNIYFVSFYTLGYPVIIFVGVYFHGTNSTSNCVKNRSCLIAEVPHHLDVRQNGGFVSFL